jgi:hypothetical protein
VPQQHLSSPSEGGAPLRQQDSRRSRGWLTPRWRPYRPQLPRPARYSLAGRGVKSSLQGALDLAAGPSAAGTSSAADRPVPVGSRKLEWAAAVRAMEADTARANRQLARSPCSAQTWRRLARHRRRCRPRSPGRDRQAAIAIPAGLPPGTPGSSFSTRHGCVFWLHGAWAHGQVEALPSPPCAHAHGHPPHPVLTHPCVCVCFGCMHGATC